MATKKKSLKLHSEKDSPFYKLESRRRLAEILHCSQNRFALLDDVASLYTPFDRKKKDGTTRRIDAPREDLKTTQLRIANLLQRIEPPDFLFAPVPGRSYVNNAAAHRGAKTFHLLDLENFFPSCRDDRVTWFFRKRMLCSPDVTAVLRQLTTLNGSLPQGSPCSPILAYFAYIDMWEEIDNYVKERGCKLTVYIDDVTISGPVIHGELIWKIKTIFHRFQHTYKVNKERCVIDKPIEVTGVVLREENLLLPNRQHKKMHDLRIDIMNNLDPRIVKSIKNQLRGCAAQMKQVLGFGKKKT